MKTYYIANDNYECSNSIYGSETPVCLDMEEVERLSREWGTPIQELLDMMHEADADEISEYGVYDSEEA